MSHHFIEFNNVHYEYPNGNQALKGISFRANHREKIAFIGENGAGKSTLILHINGLLRASSGVINMGGKLL